MKRGLATPDEKKAIRGYTDSGSGVAEVERSWCLQPVYEPDPRTVFRPRRHVATLEVSTQSRLFDMRGSPASAERVTAQREHARLS